MAFAIVILGLVVIITVHELGHFLAAKAVGVRATKFYVFFPPALWKRTWRGVEYGIGAIPLGGFVRLPGMFEPVGTDVHWRLEPLVERVASGVADADLRLQLTSAFRQLPAASTPEEIVGRLRDVDEALARAAATQDVAIGPFEASGVEVFRRQVRRLRSRVAGVIDDAHPQAYWRAALWRRMTVIFAGPAINIVLAWLALMLFWMFLVPNFEGNWQVGSVTKGSPAAEAGVRPGDRIVSWGGTRLYGDARSISKDLDRTRGKPLTVVVERDGERLRHQLQPRKLEGQGSRKLVGIGLEMDRSTARQVGYERNSPGVALRETNRIMVQVPAQQLRGLARILSGRDLDQASSVVGVVQRAPEAERAIGLVMYFALINLAIAVINLLPLLPLDGGHLAFGLVEALRRGRPLPREAFERASVVGLALVFGLFFIGLRNDLGLGG